MPCLVARRPSPLAIVPGQFSQVLSNAANFNNHLNPENIGLSSVKIDSQMSIGASMFDRQPQNKRFIYTRSGGEAAARTSDDGRLTIQSVTPLFPRSSKVRTDCRAPLSVTLVRSLRGTLLVRLRDQRRAASASRTSVIRGPRPPRTKGSGDAVTRCFRPITTTPLQ